MNLNTIHSKFVSRLFVPDISLGILRKMEEINRIDNYNFPPLPSQKQSSFVFRSERASQDHPTSQTSSNDFYELKSALDESNKHVDLKVLVRKIKKLNRILSSCQSRAEKNLKTIEFLSSLDDE